MPLTEKHPLDPPALRPLERFFKRQLLKSMANVGQGCLSLHDADGTVRLGSAPTRCNVRVVNPRFYRRAALGGSLAVAQSFLDGDWQCDDLTGLFRMLLQNSEAAARLEGPWARMRQWAERARHWLRANTRRGSRRNIRAHYDLGNDFFAQWLDDTWAYSCGIFRSPQATLAEASTEKFDRICRKLDLGPADHVLEIGSGWGGFAVHAASRYGCRVTTTTISPSQFELARQKIAAAGLSHRITLVQQDYRELKGQFDKLVSIEMIEAVGHEFLGTYFRQCGQLLKPTGSMLLQAIVMPERRYEAYLNSVDFIRRYVFPGGSLPSIAAMLTAVGRTGGLRLVHLEDFAPHYGETLRRWRANFSHREAAIRALGYDDMLIRLWHYYLCYCEAAFEERAIGLVHLQFDNYACRRDPLGIGDRAAAAGAEPAFENQPGSAGRKTACLA